MQMRQRGCCCALDAKYIEELADAKAENDALRDDVAAGRRRADVRPVSRVKLPPPGVDNAASPPTGRHRRTGLFHPQERLTTGAKTTGRNSRSILRSSADIAHIDGQLMQLL